MTYPTGGAYRFSTSCRKRKFCEKHVSRKTSPQTYILLPSQLSLDFCGPAIDIYDLELLYKDRKTEGGHPKDTRDLLRIHADAGQRFRLPCYVSLLRRDCLAGSGSIHLPSSSSIHRGFFDVPE